MTIEEFWEIVTAKFRDSDERWGQAMFNTLQVEAGIDTAVVDNVFDSPFYRVHTRASAANWFHKYVEVNDQGIIVGVREYKF